MRHEHLQEQVHRSKLRVIMVVLHGEEARQVNESVRGSWWCGFRSKLHMVCSGCVLSFCVFDAGACFQAPRYSLAGDVS